MAMEPSVRAASVRDGRRRVVECQRARLPRVPHVGGSPKRADDPRILTGRGRYVDDLAPARCVHVAVVRSLHAHARLTALRLDAARRAPGVVAVLTGEAAQEICAPCRGILKHYTGMKTGA